jgi:23S rRNA (uracil1939-C5)-methyltransferase
VGMEGECMLILESRNPSLPGLELEEDLSVVHLTGDDATVMAGDDHVRICLKDRIFQISARSFFQVNTLMALRMVDYLQEHLPIMGNTTLLDVYCGAGLFSTFFAGHVARLIGIETSASACEDFTTNLAEFDNVELYEAPAEAVLHALEVSPDVVIVDPPRAGLDKSIIEALLGKQPGHIAYVSCNPSTLSRDLGRFIVGGYQLKQITPFDLFPQTSSIESISILEKG